MYEIEGISSTRYSCLHFLNRSIPFFPKMEVLLRPKEQSFIKTDVLFLDEISGLAMTTLFELKTSCTNMIKVKFVQNTRFIGVTKN